jgi:adenosylcobinamide amidohydrolase
MIPPPAVRLLSRTENGRTWPVLVWAPGPGWRAVSSGIVGGGLGPRAWWLDAQVDKEYFHPDPVAHARDIAAGLGLPPYAGVAMLTAADVGRWTQAHDAGVTVAATVGLGLPVLAAVPPDVAAHEADEPAGTINVLVVVPVPLSDAALVNAVVTATEAKAQALAEAGLRATGTSSDAVCVACAEPAGPQASDTEPEPYGGPRSVWGGRIARAVHAAVAAGTADWFSAVSAPGDRLPG